MMIRKILSWWSDTLDLIVIDTMSQDKYIDVAQLVELLVSSGHTADTIHSRFRHAEAAIIWAWFIRRYATLAQKGKGIKPQVKCYSCQTVIEPGTPRMNVTYAYTKHPVHYCPACAHEIVAKNGLTLADVSCDWETKTKS